MAHLQLKRQEAEEGELPLLCMRCGTPATVTRRYRYSWHPRWVYLFLLAGLLPFAGSPWLHPAWVLGLPLIGLIPFIVLAFRLTRTMRVQISLCNAHKNHWSVRTMLIWGTFGLFILSLVGSVLILMLMEMARLGRSEDFCSLVCLEAVIGSVCWLIGVAIIHNTAIHPSEITETSVTLARISQEFVKAVREYRRHRGEDEPPPDDT